MGELTVAEIKAAVHEVIDEQRRNFWVEPEEHWRHHEQLRECVLGKPEWSKNHEFITEIRQAGATVKKVSLVTLVTAFCGVIGYCIKLVWTAVLVGAK